MPSHTPIDGAPRDGSLVLVSNDDQQIRVEEVIMTRCRFIAREAEGLGVTATADPIHLPISYPILSHIVAFCTHYRGEYLQEDDPEALPLPERDPNDEGPSPVRPWDEVFLEVDRDTLYAILKAAHFLELNSLVNSGARVIANMIRGKTTEEMRTILGIENDFTPEEEAENRRKAEELIRGMEESNVVNVNRSSVSNQPTIFQQVNIDNLSLSGTQRSTIEAILYDTPGAWVTNGPHETLLVVASLTSDPWWQIDSVIQRIDALVHYMTSEREDMTVSGFIDAAKRELSEPAWPQDPQQHYRLAWETLFTVVRFPMWTDTRPERFTDLRDALFAPDRKASRKRRIDWTVDDLERAGITVRLTYHLHQHLQLDGSSTVLVFGLRGAHEAGFLARYAHNKVAQVLGLDQLGVEVLASLGSMSGKDPLYRRVRELGLLPGEDKAFDASFPIAAINAQEHHADKLDVRTLLCLN